MGVDETRWRRHRTSQRGPRALPDPAKALIMWDNLCGPVRSSLGRKGRGGGGGAGLGRLRPGCATMWPRFSLPHAHTPGPHVLSIKDQSVGPATTGRDDHNSVRCGRPVRTWQEGKERARGGRGQGAGLVMVGVQEPRFRPP